MSFYAYMLHCADRSFYVGHTDDLQRRISEHESGLVPGHTSERLPVKLVWSQDFPTRKEARTAEAQLKGWSRAKKLALIRSDWAAISALAKSRKGGASTSSAKPGFEVGRFLHPHLGFLPSEPLSLKATIRSRPERLLVRYRLTGAIDDLAIPPRTPSSRQNELWRHSCFELFIKTDEGPGYVELNFSPSTQWAAYQFDNYRAGMSLLDIEPPHLLCNRERYAVELTATVQLPRPLTPTRIGLSAVIQESAGHKSYWALAHPPGAPDFHHPDCFTLELAAPDPA